jgi:UDP-N-acetylmuramyl pentapeptide phosphotransferase/UDP-N-acetylglucosamine-1-phosphate transferase
MVMSAVIGWLIVDHAVASVSAGLSVVVLAGGAAAVLGFVDDVVSLSPGTKLLALIAVGWSVAASLNLGLDVLPAALTVPGITVWILLCTNAFNFMDGSDGLAAGVAAIAAAILSVMVWRSGDVAVASWLLVVTAVCVGFLAFNAPPASIFMGDAGSYFLGVSLSVLSVQAIRAGVTVVAIGILWHPFLFDVVLTLMSRLRRGQKIWQAHREHLYQRLMVLGDSHRDVAVRYYLWQIVAGMCAVTFQLGGRPIRVLALGVAAAFSAGIVRSVRARETA